MLSTKQKIFFAMALQQIVMAFRRLIGLGSVTMVKRGGIYWELDLMEGIDFSIWLLGSFEPNTVRCYGNIVKHGDTVLDVGANIGAHTLQFARIVGDSGVVIAFEPTDYAFFKLRQNLLKNPKISTRVKCLQLMLIDKDEGVTPPNLYSSWPLEKNKDLHAEHQGKLMSTKNASATTLDAVMLNLKVGRIDFIKIDIDGFECEMLRGARQTLKKWRPKIIMEIAPYVLEEHGASVEELLSVLHAYEYSIFSLDNKTEFPMDSSKIRALIPRGSSLNVIAMAKGNHNVK